MGLLKTATLAVLFGSLYTLFRKYQSVIEITPGSEQFNQPMYHSTDLDYKVLLSLLACLRLSYFDLGLNLKKQTKSCIFHLITSSFIYCPVYSMYLALLSILQDYITYTKYKIDKCFSKPDAERVSSILHLYVFFILSKTYFAFQKTCLYGGNFTINCCYWIIQHFNKN